MEELGLKVKVEFMSATTTLLASTLATALIKSLEWVVVMLLSFRLLLRIQRIRAGVELLTHFRIQEYLVYFV